MTGEADRGFLDQLNVRHTDGVKCLLIPLQLVFPRPLYSFYRQAVSEKQNTTSKALKET